MNESIHGGGTSSGKEDSPIPHQPVLYHEVLEALSPSSGRDYLDGTLGAGGHAEGILMASAPRGRLLGIDLDPVALTIARQRLMDFGDRVIIDQASYQNAPEILKRIGWHQVHGILLDLGVSSMQIDQPERGFSFMTEGPLDMRFNQNTGTSAADLVNAQSEKQLADILWKFGEERFSRRIARAIVAARPLHTTGELANVIQRAVPGYEPHLHPATRTFQALRIAVNQELRVIADALPRLLDCLAPGGRIAVISFHSLEDRIVKDAFRRESRDCICPPEQPICTCHHTATIRLMNRKPITATEQEISENPRSRSVRLRVAEKLEATQSLQG